MAEYRIPEELRYSEQDEWVRSENERVVIGVSDFAQSQLGDIVFVELPDVGAAVEAGVPFGTIESVKAVSDLFSPVSGEVVAVNEALEDSPEKVNEDCYGEGWLIEVQPSNAGELDELLDASGYLKSIAARED
ncbi:MAG: glycine cleavage system protein GcvH [Deltaproteobacteria bacterium]|jgi:glycine cleavage system H protein|nr:glycine cleavage system protein GcvH [Deltaproteobacteria bacterium]MBW2499435.1 glycine cleavage system protein GcvH [Deltaproteobacteria bacterium]